MRLPILTLAVLLLAPTALANPDWQEHGAPLSNGRYRAIAGVVEHSGRWDGNHVRVEGEVVSVCRKKGCWMELKAGDTTVRVSFKDYGFFVPLDCDGSIARVDGIFRVREVPVEEARHYLEDAGESEKAAAITEPVRTFELVASGVALRAK